MLFVCVVCACFCILFFFFFFKQKTAYEMRISDWSSDVCSSDLLARFLRRYAKISPRRLVRRPALVHATPTHIDLCFDARWVEQIGRASCRERVCQYV